MDHGSNALRNAEPGPSVCDADAESAPVAEALCDLEATMVDGAIVTDQTTAPIVTGLTRAMEEELKRIF